MRRLLVTSAGLRNDSPRDTLAGLLDGPFGDARLAFMPTASVADRGDHSPSFPERTLRDDVEVVSEGEWRLLDAPAT